MIPHLRHIKLYLHTRGHAHTYTQNPGAQQDKPALVVSGLFDFWDEMSEQSTLRHCRTDVYECVCTCTHTCVCTPEHLHAISFTWNQRENPDIRGTLKRERCGCRAVESKATISLKERGRKEREKEEEKRETKEEGREDGVRKTERERKGERKSKRSIKKL